MIVEIKYVSTVAIIGESGDDGSIKAKFHYTGPTGPARTRTDPNGLCRRPGPQKSPCGSGRARVVEFNHKSVCGLLAVVTRCSRCWR